MAAIPTQLPALHRTDQPFLPLLDHPQCLQDHLTWRVMMYDPFIGKILTYAFERPNAINDMRIFMDNITIRGIRTNLVFLKHLLGNEDLRQGGTIIDFLHLKFDFSKLKNTEEEAIVAAALLAADFHIDNRKKDYKAKLEKMKQPGFLKRLFSSY
jgi:acetyl/propionyl-CoA carboxylase alpha subunit